MIIKPRSISYPLQMSLLPLEIPEAILRILTPYHFKQSNSISVICPSYLDPLIK